MKIQTHRARWIRIQLDETMPAHVLHWEIVDFKTRETQSESVKHLIGTLRHVFETAYDELYATDSVG